MIARSRPRTQTQRGGCLGELLQRDVGQEHPFHAGRVQQPEQRAACRAGRPRRSAGGVPPAYSVDEDLLEGDVEAQRCELQGHAGVPAAYRRLLPGMRSWPAPGAASPRPWAPGGARGEQDVGDGVGVDRRAIGRAGTGRRPSSSSANPTAGAGSSISCAAASSVMTAIGCDRSIISVIRSARVVHVEGHTRAAGAGDAEQRGDRLRRPSIAMPTRSPGRAPDRAGDARRARPPTTAAA